MSKASTIFLILPTYNEAKGIATVITNVAEIFSSANVENWHMIIVDDGSLDTTCAIVESMPYPITLIRHKRNLGLGLAMKTGLLAAGRLASDEDYILSAESDGAQSLKTLLNVIKKLEQGYDYVVASPLIGSFVGVPLYRRILSHGANWLYRTLFPMDILRDYTNLMRGVRARFVHQAVAFYGSSQFLRCSGFEGVPEFPIKIRRFSPNVGEVPVTIDFSKMQRGSSIAIVKTIFKSLSLCARESLYQLRVKNRWIKKD